MADDDDTDTGDPAKRTRIALPCKVNGRPW